MYNNKPVIYPIEKIISVLSYFTSGFAGLIYLIIALIRKQGLRPFVRYHIFMSIFLSILIYVIGMVLILIINICNFIPFVKQIVLSITVLFNSELISLFGLHFSLISLIVLSLYLYLSIGAIMGKYTYLPWVSKIISYNLHQ